MIRIELAIELHDEVDAHGADFVFNVHAARTRRQGIAAERLVLSPALDARLHVDPVTGNRRLRLRAGPGVLDLAYTATVDLDHEVCDPDRLEEVPIHRLPPEAIGYIYPSRYCQSDRLLRLAAHAFGHLPRGHARVQAICDWVKQRVSFTPNSSDASTSAVDTLIEEVGVCRDFAHLMIALCRALSLPARFVSGTDYGADPALGPPDFHAYVEVFLGGRWVIFDPSGTAIPMGLVRLGTGRDAADAAFATAFATVFGGVRSAAPVIRALAVEDPSGGFTRPRHGREALSTDSGPGAPPGP